jgi:hypothetical protein
VRIVRELLGLVQRGYDAAVETGKFSVDRPCAGDVLKPADDLRQRRVGTAVVGHRTVVTGKCVTGLSSATHWSSFRS